MCVCAMSRLSDQWANSMTCYVMLKGEQERRKGKRVRHGDRKTEMEKKSRSHLGSGRDRHGHTPVLEDKEEKSVKERKRRREAVKWRRSALQEVESEGRERGEIRLRAVV